MSIFMLPHEPSLQDVLGGSLSGLAGGIAGGLQQQMQRQQQMQQAAKAIPLYQQLFPEMSQEQLMSLASQPTQIQQEMVSGLMKQKETSLKQQYGQQIKTQAAREEQEKASEGLKQSFSRLEELLPYSGWQIPFTKSHVYGGLARERVQKREEFNTLGFWAADAVYTHFNKGVLSKEKLAVLKDNLSPKTGLTVRENRARINALRKISNLPRDIDSSKLNKIIDKEVEKTSKDYQSFNVGGENYNIPIELVPEFKREMGIK